MVLFRLHDFDATFHKNVGEHNINNYDVYSDIRDDKVGSIKDVLVDEAGSLRYLVIDTAFWVQGKHVLLPIGRCRVDDTNRRVYAKGLTREQVQYLPEYDELEQVNYDYEEKVRKVYRNIYVQAPLETMTPLETEIPLEAPVALDSDFINNQQQERTIHKEIPAFAEPLQPIPQPVAPQPVNNRETYVYQQEPDLYEMNEHEHNTLRLYEERLIANKQRVKTGEVTLGKHVETETVNVTVPVEKERVIVERITPIDTARVASTNETAFKNKEVVRMDIYEETPEIQKQAVVKEEVRVKKVVEQDTVQATEQVRREELDINTLNDKI
ncbi:PRC-barrel domain-containing protein AvaK [Calothrix sp. PCC 7716]|nr:PRC-barrel domain-containing protein AvaK [Calothrix sp. PCC 7716]